MRLNVRVNNELLLDAGTTEEPAGSEVIVHPPKVTLFHQVLDYLHAKSDPPTPPTIPDYEGAAAAAIALRWGSYLAVLADSAKPLWAEAHSPEASRICN